MQHGFIIPLLPVERKGPKERTFTCTKCGQLKRAKFRMYQTQQESICTDCGKDYTPDVVSQYLKDSST